MSFGQAYQIAFREQTLIQKTFLLVSKLNQNFNETGSNDLNMKLLLLPTLYEPPHGENQQSA